ncbi:MAG: hypothetical protein MJZ82_02990 [Paludibacteraceae bacterium]|nr:hypothetical protein [Paludibacteraceae bacterium]
MAQLSISFGIELGNLPQNKQVNVKVAHRTSITANVADVEDVNWGDIYEDYVDFEYTSQKWK